MIIRELFEKDFGDIKATNQREPKLFIHTEQELEVYNSKTKSFEQKVFNYLYDHKEELGIKKVMSFKNMRIEEVFGRIK